MQSVHSFQSSRDPAGVDPSGVDIIAGTDPPLKDESDDPPILPPKSLVSPPPPTPRRTYSEGNMYRASSPVMAFLVGNPPPPPTTPPPKKKSPRHPPRQAAASPPGNTSVSVSPSYTAVSFPSDFQGSTSEEHKDGNAALATSGSSVMYMAAEQHEESERNIVYTDSNPASVADPDYISFDENESSNREAPLASPRSAATEPHSNKREVGSRVPQIGINDSQSSSDSSSNKVRARGLNKTNPIDGVKRGRARLSASGLRSRLQERRDRSKSLERRTGRSPEHKRSGFFKKLFRGGKKKTQERMEDRSGGSLDETTTDAAILPPHNKKEENSGPKVSFLDHVSEDGHSDAQTQHTAGMSLGVDTQRDDDQSTMEASLGRSEVELGLDTVTSGLTNDIEPDRREIFFAHDEVSTLTAPSTNSYGRLSIDPHEATVMNSGRFSEPVGRYWNEISNNAKKSFSSIAGNVDPFTEPFFREPDGESPITSNKTEGKAQLKISVLNSLEPTGETPRTNNSPSHMNEPSPRGWESPITELKDPMGSTYTLGSGVAHQSDASRQHGNKIPSVRRNLPHELQREPSAFRDGSPYALDPPLRAFDDDETNSKSLLGLINRAFISASKNRAATEPLIPTLNDSYQVGEHQNQAGEHQISTPPMHAKEDKKMASLGVGEGHVVDGWATTIRCEDEEAKKTMTDRPINHDVLKKQDHAVKQDAQDVSGFLDDLFQEKTSSKQNSFAPAPITSQASGEEKSSYKTDGYSSGAPEAHSMDFHRTQRVSMSTATTLEGVNTSGVLSDKQENDLLYEKSNVTQKLSAVLQRRRQQISGCEEEKKEADLTTYALSDEELPKMRNSVLATSTTALGTAASMNAKTVRYLHTLNGEPSPRHSWRRADLSDDEYSPTKSELQRKAMSNIKATMLKKQVVTSSISTSLASKKNLSVRDRFGAFSPRSRKLSKKNFKRPVYYARCNRDVRVRGLPLRYGLNLLRKQHEDDILSGRTVRTCTVQKARQKKHLPSQFQIVCEEDVKDPIQRAGRRLLSKAAIPIQSAARKYLARREARARMSATIALQSYFRRWKCGAYRRAYCYACTKVQAIFRSWMVREELNFQHVQTVQIQRIVRGYLATAYVYDTIYWISRLQAAMRGKLARIQLVKLQRLEEDCALLLQSWYRGCVARNEVRRWIQGATTVQAAYRSYIARVNYQVAVVDIIIVQGFVRQFLARKVTQKMRMEEKNKAACKIQATWRGFQGYTDYIFALVDILVLQRSMRKWLAKKKADSLRRHKAATKIQAQWRRQTALIGMLYDLVHIIITQSLIRRFLTQRKLPQLRSEYERRMKEKSKLDSAATKIQTAWRGFWGYSHFIIMQYEIVRLQAIIRARASRTRFSLKLGCCIMIQSAVRRFLANRKMHKLKIARVAQAAAVEGMRMRLACQRIQFWWRVVLECNKEKSAALTIERFFLMVKSEVDKEIRRQSYIQKASKRSRRARQRDYVGEEDDDILLERVWLNTVDEDRVDIFACSSSQEGGQQSRGQRSQSAPRLHPNPSYISEPSGEGTPSSRGVQHHPSSPNMKLVMRYEDDPAMRRELDMKTRQEEALRASRRYQKSKSKPPPDVTLAKSDERTEVSAITSPTVFKKGKRPSKSKRSSKRRELEDELSLAESLLGEGIRQEQNSTDGDEDKQLHSAPNKTSRKQHFFSDEAETLRKYPEKQVARRHHSTSSIASGSDVLSEASDIHSHFYSRTATATTMTRTTHSETVDSESPSHNDVELRERQYRKERYNSAASKGKKLLEQVRKTSPTRSPRHGKIIIQNSHSDHPILSQDSYDNVEVEYVGGQFGMI